MWGQIASAVVGGYMSQQAAKKQAAATAAANAASNQGYTDAKPYITDVYKRGKAALNDILDTGYYQGDTYAALNDTQMQGYNNQVDFNNTGFADANQMLNVGRGYSDNYQDLYNQAQRGFLNNAMAYGTDAANINPIADAALRDARRNLNENTLRGIDMNASLTGNTNSSRSGVADAIASRGFADREADVRAQISNDLIDRSLAEQQNQYANMVNANQNLAGVYNTGFSQGNISAGNIATAGGALQRDEQNILNQDRASFEGNRDFAMEQLNNYNTGILGQSPRTSGSYQADYVDPNMAALGGAMAGYGFGGQFAAAPAPAPTMSYINADAYKGYGYTRGR